MRLSKRRMRWTRNTLFKARCVVAEMRAMCRWVDTLGSPTDNPLTIFRIKRDLVRGHLWKLASLTRELPLALVLDTPGLRTLWMARKRRKHSPITK